MTVVLLKDAKNRLEELLAASAEGEEVVIAREDGSTFQVIPTETPTKKKRGLVGSAKGWFRMTDDFDEPLEDFKDYM
jgi:antitoxin (DNA-binding transcriptional repressor) of toxin-antitoxin stability system